MGNPAGKRPGASAPTFPTRRKFVKIIKGRPKSAYAGYEMRFGSPPRFHIIALLLRISTKLCADRSLAGLSSLPR